jgi:hypothetical protein
MEIFIMVIYVITILVVPQIYTWMIRQVLANWKEEDAIIAMLFGGVFTVFILIAFTVAIINWDLISI